MISDFTAVIMAAGRGTRMRSALPKVMHKIAQQPIIEYVISTAKDVTDEIVVVISSELEICKDFKKLVEKHKIKTVRQKCPIGTADAVRSAIALVQSEYTMILCGDVPFLSSCTIKKMQNQEADLVVLGFDDDTVNSYGRIILDENGCPVRIVEVKDATDHERKIIKCNAGVFLVKTTLLKNFLNAVKNDNNSGEYYLTDMVEFIYKHFKSSKMLLVMTDDREEVMGVNDKSDLARAELICQQNLRAAMLSDGVHMIAPQTVFLTPTTKINPGTVIHPFVVLGQDVMIDSDVTILSFCQIEGAKIARGSVLGPFARIRPKTELMQNVKIGNFVEVKNSIVENGSKASHLSYIGDVAIGEGVNIGAGTVFCNYDGYMKHKSKVAKNSFIGSNSCIISPIEIDEEAFIAAGSVITRDVPAGNLAVSRAQQKNVERKRKKL